MKHNFSKVLSSLILLLLVFSQFLVNAQAGNIPCNTESPLVNGPLYNNLTASKNVACLGIASISGEGNLVDGNINNSASVDIAVSAFVCNLTLGVKDGNDTYPSGTWAGFRISTGGLLPGATIGAGVMISTYLNGVLQENYDAGTALAGISLGLNLGSATNVGFVTTKPFDEVKIRYTSFV